MKPAVFLEQDGVLNLVRVENNHQVAALTLDDFRVNLAALEPLRRLKEHGFVLVVTSNQPGVARGYLPRCELDRMHRALRRAFPIDDILICPHDEMDRCPCRKPKPGLFAEAAYRWQLDLDHSYVVSDKWQDADAARQVGCTSVMIASPWVGRVHHDVLLPSISELAAKIIQIHHADRYAFL